MVQGCCRGRCLIRPAPSDTRLACSSAELIYCLSIACTLQQQRQPCSACSPAHHHTFQERASRHDQLSRAAQQGACRCRLQGSLCSCRSLQAWQMILCTACTSSSRTSTSQPPTCEACCQSAQPMRFPAVALHVTLIITLISPCLWLPSATWVKQHTDHGLLCSAVPKAAE